MNENGTTPGIDFQADANARNCFTGEEYQIFKKWKNEWYITRAGRVGKGKSEYNYFLIRPIQEYEDAFGIFKELIVLFSSYEDSFDARTLDAVDLIIEECSANRIEKICCAIISKYSGIKDAIRLYNNNEEARIYIPFSYDEFSEQKFGTDLINKRLRENLYQRDLFNISNPLKEDRYFFGRSEIMMEIIKAHKAFSNFGLFGLRKSGKTSVMFNVLRRLHVDDVMGAYIDCQNTDFHGNRWFDALKLVIRELVNTNTIDLKCETEFTEKNATSLFEEYIRKINKITCKSIILFFDEIENIAFEKSPSQHWANGLDFVLFWQCIRHVSQKTVKIFSFCILGTNPKCVEASQILGKDNPIYNIFKPRYIAGLDINKTKEMVQTLGRVMGMTFEDDVCITMFRDYGGHPFLIRRLCSMISSHNTSRPIIIDRRKYSEIKDKFDKENNYFEMILGVLKQFYDIEYDLLLSLANGDEQLFEEYASDNYDFVKHLIGYGIVREINGKYDFQIDSIKNYLIRTNKTISKHLKVGEKWKAICGRRNIIETQLRDLNKIIIRASMDSEAEAKDYVLS
ncbi:MAG: hypothetical protein FWC00_06170, partial [Firmicutes bacterium]|nr:hypothetical protein [Bacillota bacterium]